MTKREIKFRGKQNADHEWVYGDLLRDDVSTYIRTDAWAPPGTPKERSVDPDTVGQYTGLMDKYAIKIYEGDILELTDDDTGEKSRYTVQMSDKTGGYTVKEIGTGAPEDAMCDWEAQVDGWAVVGNVWDNPELLEGETQ